MVKLIVLTLLAIIPITATTVHIDQDDYLYEQFRCMKLVIYHEARGESPRGMQAVANVVMNRVSSGRFPDSVCDVVYQRHRNTCQFSWYCDERLARREPNIGTQIKQIAYDAVVRNELRDITNGAMWFHSGEPVWWAESKTLTRQIGGHKFYR